MQLSLIETQEEKLLDRDIKLMTYQLAPGQNFPVTGVVKMKKQWLFRMQHAQLSALQLNHHMLLLQLDVCR